MADWTLHVVNGPNLNFLGRRDPTLYGPLTLPEIEEKIRAYCLSVKVTPRFFQSNSEGGLIDYLQSLQLHAEGKFRLVINPGGLAHSSIPLRDCLELIGPFTIEVHLSHLSRREDFRRHSLTAEVTSGLISGLGWRGYIAAIQSFLLE